MVLRVGNHRRSRALLVVVCHMVDPRAHWMRAHRAASYGFSTSETTDRHVRHARIEPQIIAVLVKDHWHSVVDGRGHGIWSRGKNRAGLHPISASVFPSVPECRECEQLASVHFEAVWLFTCARAPPLIKTVCRDQTSAEFQRIAKGRLRGGCLRLRVYRARRDGGVFCPMRNQTPTHG